MSHEILAHPADIKFRTEGATLEEAFSEVVEALAALVDGEDRTQTPTARRTVEIEAESLESLLFDFLDRLIMFQDVDDVVVSHAEKLDIDDRDGGYTLSAVIHANPITADQPLLDVKAPTYSQMTVESDDGWTIESVLDV